VRRLLVASVVTAALGVTGPAIAGDRSDEARAAFERANGAYETGDIDGALRQMQEAYRLSSLPQLLYNVAKLERELGRCRPALVDYRRYLAEAPGGPTTDAAARAASELDRECGVGPTGYWRPRRVIGWSALAAGAAAGTVAVVFSVAARGASNDVEESAKRAQSQRAPYDAHDRELDGRRDQTLASVFAVAAGAFTAGGILLLVLGPHEGERVPATNVDVAPLPGGGEFTYGARF
jgi:hypothetical protein